MTRQITLELDEESLRRATGWASARGMTLETALIRLIGDLPNPPSNHAFTPWLESLAGSALRADGSEVESAVSQDYVDYLEQKYQ